MVLDTTSDSLEIMDLPFTINFKMVELYGNTDLQIDNFMKISLSGLPTNLLNSYYKIFKKKDSLLQVLNREDYSAHPVNFSIPQMEIINIMYNLSRIEYFDTLYLYNILDETSELYMGNLPLIFDVSFDENNKVNSGDYEKFRKTQTITPWLFPYSKILLPNLPDLYFFMIDIEEINLSFLLVNKNIKNFYEIQKTISTITFFGNDHEKGSCFCVFLVLRLKTRKQDAIYSADSA